MGDYDHLIGELTPGDYGWLPLDGAGTPSGPATLNPPPGPDAKAAHVFAPEDGPDALVTGSGAPIDPPLNSNVDKRVPGSGSTPTPPEALTLGSLSPNTAEMGSADLVMTVIGTGFTQNSMIVFNEGDEVTTYVDSNNLTTTVKPSLVSAAIQVPVQVREGQETSAPLMFEFTAPAMRQGQDQRRR